MEAAETGLLTAVQSICPAKYKEIEEEDEEWIQAALKLSINFVAFETNKCILLIQLILILSRSWSLL